MYPIRVGKELVERGYRVFGLCIANTQVAQGMQDAGIECFEAPSKSALLTTQIFTLEKWLKNNNITIVHCHKSGDILVSALLNLLTKRRAIFTEHMGVSRPKKDLYHRWVYSHIDQVFSISDETYQRNLKALPVPSNKIQRLWLGTDIPTTPIESKTEIDAIKSELGIPRTATVVGNVGRICSGKGQMELIEAFATLAPHHLNLHLLLVGALDVSEGSDNAFVAQIRSRIKELKLTARIHLAGFRKDTDRMLAAMDIVCLPNHNEAFGLTAIEAMAAKKAIVGANTGALPEILAPVALLCDPFSPEKIALNIENYLHDAKMRSENAKLAFERAQQEFSMASHITKLTNFYGLNNG